MTPQKLPNQPLEQHFNQSKGNYTKILITILIIALISLGAYLGYDKGLKPYLEQRDINAQIYGQQLMYSAIIQELTKCNPEGLKLTLPNNQTLTAFAVECLNKGGKLK